MKRRRKIALAYDKLISQSNLLKPIKQNVRGISANHLYPVVINFSAISCGKNDLMLKLRKKGIITQVHYVPIPLHPFYQKLGYSMDQLPNALNFYYNILSIPIYPGLSYLEQRKIIRSLNSL